MSGEQERVGRPRVGRPPGPTPDRDERREELLDAAVKAIELGGPDVSMQQIAEVAGFTRPIFYDHFGDRSGLAAAVLDRYAVVFSERVAGGFSAQASLVDAIVAAFDAFCDFAETNENLYRFLRHAALAVEVTSALDDVTGTRLGELVAAQLADSGCDPAMGEEWGQALLAMSLGTAEWWLTTRAVPRERLVEHLRVLLESGLPGPS